MQRAGEDGQAQGLRVVAEAVYDLATIRKRHAKVLRLACNGGAEAARLSSCSRRFATAPARSSSNTATAAIGGEIELPESWRVNLDDPLLARLREWLAPENVRVVY